MVCFVLIGGLINKLLYPNSLESATIIASIFYLGGRI